MPVVSLLVPICDAEGDLEGSLESAKAQYLEDIEVICINGTESVSVARLIKGYASSDSRFSVKNVVGASYGAAINAGLVAAKGKYVAFLDPGDILDKIALERLSSLAVACNADVAKGDYWTFPEEGKHAGKRKEAESIPFAITGKLINIEEAPDIMFQKHTVWSAVYKRGMLARNNLLFDEEAPAARSGIAFMLKVWICARRAVFTKTPFVERHGLDFPVPGTRDELSAFCDEYAAAEEFLGKHEDKLEAFTPLLLRAKYLGYLACYKGLPEDLRVKFVERMHDEFAAAHKAGAIDKNVFEADEYSDVEMLAKSAKDFDEMQQKYSGDARGDNIKRYAKSGGASLLGKMFAKKLKKDKNDDSGSPYAR